MSDEPADGTTRSNQHFVENPLAALLESVAGLPASDITRVVDLAGDVLEAESARLLIADYAQLSLQELGEDGPTGLREQIEGTLAGRAFTHDEIVVSGAEPTTVWVPLTEGSERLGVLKLTHRAWNEDRERSLPPVLRVLVLVLISKRRYTDAVLQSRRVQPLSMAAEMQWTLLPPLSYSNDQVSVSGILEPAYSIGGDSFDYALNSDRLEFAIVDAIGHGLNSVLLSALAINGLRNVRREGKGLTAAYHETGAVVKDRFGPSAFVTAQIGSLDLDTGTLSWINAGHPLPLLVRSGKYIGELSCQPSLPLGLGESVTEIATERLQPGDRVLFYSDGAIETRSSDGETFGVARLADLLVRATLDGTVPPETVRRLSISILAHNPMGLSDDATLLVVEYRGMGSTGSS